MTIFFFFLLIENRSRWFSQIITCFKRKLFTCKKRHVSISYILLLELAPILIFTLAPNGSNCIVEAVFSDVISQRAYSFSLKTVW